MKAKPPPVTEEDLAELVKLEMSLLNSIKFDALVEELRWLRGEVADCAKALLDRDNKIAALTHLRENLREENRALREELEALSPYESELA